MLHPRQLPALLLGALILLAATLPTRGDAPAAPDAAPIWVFIGTMIERKANPGERGIYGMKLDRATGTLSAPELACEVGDPYYITTDPKGRFIYSANLNNHRIDAFSLDRQTGAVKLLNHQSAGGKAPAYVTIDETGKFALIANYTSGNVGVLPIDADGRLGPIGSVIQYKPAPANAAKRGARPVNPPAHCIVLDHDNRFALACELGLDQVEVYRFDATAGTLTPNNPPAATLTPHTEPRHLAFGPGEHFAYVIGEKDMTVNAFAWDDQRGTLAPIQKISTIEEPVRRGWSGAEIHVHPWSNFLYASLRGPNAIAVFAIDPKTGKLGTPTRQSSLGKMPQHFAIDPTGRFLLVANIDSDNIVVFRINPETGLLTPTGSTAKVPTPTCVLFVPIAKGE